MNCAKFRGPHSKGYGVGGPPFTEVKNTFGGTLLINTADKGQPIPIYNFFFAYHEATPKHPNPKTSYPLEEVPQDFLFWKSI